jgi:hypothetical protein
VRRHGPGLAKEEVQDVDTVGGDVEQRAGAALAVLLGVILPLRLQYGSCVWMKYGVHMAGIRLAVLLLILCSMSRAADPDSPCAPAR